MNMSRVKKVYNYGYGYRVFVLHNNTFESITPYNQVIFSSSNFNECADFIKSNKKFHKN